MTIENLNDCYPELGVKLSQHLSDDFEHRALIDLVVERYPSLIIELSKLEVVPGFVYQFHQKLVELEKSRNEQNHGYHWDRDRLLLNACRADMNSNVLGFIATQVIESVHLEELAANSSCTPETLHYLYDRLIQVKESHRTLESDFISNPSSDIKLLFKCLSGVRSLNHLKSLVKHPNADADLIRDIYFIPDEDIEVEKPLYSSRLDRYSTTSNDHKIKELKHAICDASIDYELAQSIFVEDSLRAKVVANPNISVVQALELFCSMYDKNSEPEASTVNDVLEAISKREDIESLPELMRSHKALHTLNANGYPLTALADTHKIKAFVKLLIGSSHKEEINFLMRGVNHTSPHLGIEAISCIQGVYTDGKLDRHGYLQRLAELNNANVLPDAFTLSVVAMKRCLGVLTWDDVLEVLSKQSALSARDTFVMISELVWHEEPEAVFKQTKLIQRWLDKNFNYGNLFHDYLSNKMKRDGDRDIVPLRFPQGLMLDKANEINKEWKKNDEHKLSVYLPCDSWQLAKVGRSQRHCVGGSQYSSACASGRSMIFSFKENGQLKHGFTFEFDCATKALVQCEGFARSPVPKYAQDMATDVFNRLNT